MIDLSLVVHGLGSIFFFFRYINLMASLVTASRNSFAYNWDIANQDTAATLIGVPKSRFHKPCSSYHWMKLFTIESSDICRVTKYNKREVLASDRNRCNFRLLLNKLSSSRSRDATFLLVPMILSAMNIVKKFSFSSVFVYCNFPNRIPLNLLYNFLVSDKFSNPLVHRSYMHFPVLSLNYSSRIFVTTREGMFNKLKPRRHISSLYEFYV